MTTLESSYKSLLQGVSQQIARERQPGQVSAQENMLSDVVTNLRRRPGAEYKFSVVSLGATRDTIKAYYTDIAGQNIHVIINISTGELIVLDVGYSVLAKLQSDYLKSGVRKHIQVSTIGDELFLLNRDIKPKVTAGGSGRGPAMRGMFYIAAGAFNKQYSVTVGTNTGSVTGTYTTPTGAVAGDAAQSTPSMIAQYILNDLNAKGLATLMGVPSSIKEAYVYFESDFPVVTVNSTTGSAYVVVSKDSYFQTEGSLPAMLPTAADGWVVRVGDLTLPKYFKYDSTRTAWLESGDYSSPLSIQDMPIALTYASGVWKFSTAVYEGRLAGDESSNPTPRFCTYGITGIGAYQGRLVLLSGSQVVLSASNKPRRFYRSTVTSLLDSDVIAVGASANSSAAYEYCVQFQKDLILFSEKYQALIPSGNQAITPRTATCVLTSSYNTDTSTSPIVMGRSLMYPVPRSDNFFGVMEMVPSAAVDSQYISADSTSHLPKYMAGKCRFSVSSSTANTVLFAPSGDTKALIVHEYIWNGDQKIQQAWHRWTFPYNIAATYFTGDTITILFVKNGILVGCSLDPKTSTVTNSGSKKPFLDIYFPTSIVNNAVTVPELYQTLDSTAYSKLAMVVRTGGLAGDVVGFTAAPTGLQTVLSFPTGDVYVGFPYTSAVSTTPPVVKDANDVVISTAKTTLLRYVIGTMNSAEYRVTVKDTNSEVTTDSGVGTLYWSSDYLSLGTAYTAQESLAVVPCRTNLSSTSMLLSTNGTGELNIMSIEYVLKFNLKIKRMEGKFK